ncbi:energy transducer TonB [Dyella sp. C9]|uniref:energy transducer TonB n=1 Tax=Dyella sp. C9 TaxID=2202154 RepID=UPI0013002446|nr:energy transducer TonB [Dyella sp. C9]
MSPVSLRRTQGSVSPSFLIVLAAVLAAGGGIFWWLKSHADADDPAPTTVAAAGPATHDGTGTGELLQRAHQAMAEQRLVAPAGNNAFEYYLAVLRREPGNQAAQDALREIFPFASRAAEQTIDDGNDAEAQREIELLAKADPQNYTLTLLQSKLQAARDTAAQQAQQASKRDGAAAAGNRPSAAQPAPVAPAPTSVPAAAPVVASGTATVAHAPDTQASSESALSRAHVESTQVVAAAVAPARPRANAVASADASGVAAPVLTQRIEPVYPPEARRARRQGWVDVTFTVQPDGSVAAAAVADADPKYVFDRAALAAVSRWQFAPGTQDGKPVAAQVRQRIEFRL